MGLARADKKRQSLCEKLNGQACTHGEERGACLRACKQRLRSGKAEVGVPRRHRDYLGKLLDMSLFVAKTCKLVAAYEEEDDAGPKVLPPLRQHRAGGQGSPVSSVGRGAVSLPVLAANQGVLQGERPGSSTTLPPLADGASGFQNSS